MTNYISPMDTYHSLLNTTSIKTYQELSLASTRHLSSKNYKTNPKKLIEGTPHHPHLHHKRCGNVDSSGVMVIKSEYKTIPDIRLLSLMSKDELRKITNFTIENNWGKIIFEGQTDITNQKLDEIIDISHGNITVYHNDYFKPPIGQKLNKPAIVHLYKCFDKHMNNIEFIQKLKRVIKEQGGEFVKYDERTGEWVFRVKHFTKYGIEEMADDSEEESVIKEGPKVDLVSEDEANKNAIAEGAKEDEQMKEIAPAILDTIPDALKEKPNQFAEASPEIREDLKDNLERTNEVHQEFRSGMFNIIEDTKSGPIDNDEKMFVVEDQEKSQADQEFAEEPIVEEGQPMCYELQYLEEREEKRKKSGMPGDVVEQVFMFEKEHPEEEMQFEFPHRNEYKSIQVDFNTIRQYEDKLYPEGLKMGQSFRVGWRHNNTFSKVKNNTTLSLCKLQTNKAIHNIIYDQIMTELWNQCNKPIPLHNKDIKVFTIDEQGMVKAIRNFVQILIDGKLKCGEEKLKMEAEVWALVNSLFGDPQVDLAEYIKRRRFSEYNTTKRSDIVQVNVLRKHLISSWLHVVTDSESQSASDEESKKISLNRIATALSNNNIEEALTIATASGIPLYGLASLFCNSTMSGTRVKELIQAQIKEWEIYKTVVNPDLLKLYTLLAKEKNEESYDWKRQFGMYIWYKSPPEKTIREVFNGFKSTEMISNISNSKQEGKDLYYGLIGAYTDITNYSPRTILNTKEYTSNHTEPRLLWLLYYTLRVMLGGKNTYTRDLLELKKNWYEDIELAVILTNKAIKELEAQGYWHWAILIYLISYNIYSSSTIIKEIEGLLERNVGDLIKYSDENVKEELLINGFKIPLSMINKAKGVYYLRNRQWTNAIQCLEQAEDWEAVHKILWEYIMPCMLIKKGLPITSISLVKTLLTTLSVHKRFIPDWNNKGLKLQRYFEIADRIKVNDPIVLNEIRILLRSFEEELKLSITEVKMIEKLKRMAVKIQRNITKYNEVRGVPLSINVKLSTGRGIDKEMLENELDLILYPGNGNELMEN